MSDKPHKIEIWEIGRLVPYAKNAKKHPETQVEKLATSIKTFGWTQPIVVWTDGSIIAGHGRRLAAISLGLTKVPVIVRSDLSRAEADALRLADNRVASTEYDMNLLQEDLRALSADFDLQLAGFDTKELDFMTADLGEIDTDFFVDDVGAAVEQQKSNNERNVQEVDDVAAPVADAFGFKRVTIAQSRTIRDLMVKMEQATGKKGVEALIGFIASKVSQV
jgi:hypothetical protein